MGTPIGLIWADIQKAQRLNDYDFKEDIVISTHMAADELSRVVDWAELRESMWVEYDGLPVQMPADMVGVVSVQDEDGREIRRVNKYTDTSPSDENFYHIGICGATHGEGVGLNIEQGADRFTINGGTVLPPLAANGDYISLGGEPGTYPLANVEECRLARAYYGPRLSNARYVVRPEDTPTISFKENGKYHVTWWRTERQLYLDEQRTVLPARALSLLIIIHILGFHEKQEKAADNYRAEYQRALSDALARNRKHYPIAESRAASGSPLRFGRQYT